jgi:hypothetical protein
VNTKIAAITIAAAQCLRAPISSDRSPPEGT